MPWQTRMGIMIGQPVAIWFRDGRGTSGILCSVQGGYISLIEFSAQTGFVLQQYPLRSIWNMSSFPSCITQPMPFRAV